MQKLKFSFLVIFLILQQSPSAYSSWGYVAIYPRPVFALEAKKASASFFRAVVQEYNTITKTNLIMLFTESAESLIEETLRSQNDGSSVLTRRQAAEELYQKLLLLISPFDQLATLQEDTRESAITALEESMEISEFQGGYSYPDVGIDHIIRMTDSYHFFGVIDILMKETQFLHRSNLALLLVSSVKEGINGFVEKNPTGENEFDIMEVTSQLLDLIITNIATTAERPQLSRGKTWMLQWQLSRLFGNFDQSFDMSRFEVGSESTCKSLISGSKRLN